MFLLEFLRIAISLLYSLGFIIVTLTIFDIGNCTMKKPRMELSETFFLFRADKMQPDHLFHTDPFPFVENPASVLKQHVAVLYVIELAVLLYYLLDGAVPTITIRTVTVKMKKAH